MNTPSAPAIASSGGGRIRHDDEFGRALRARMEERGVGVESLAAAVGVSRQTIRAWARGEWLPSSPIALAIAEALDYLPLYGIVLRHRRSQCEHCGRPLISNGGAHIRKWCNSTCRDRYRRRGAGRQSAEQLAIIRRCGQCEPMGTCYDKRCSLRPFSPFPLGLDTITPIAAPSRPVRWTPERRAAQAERMRNHQALRRSVRVA